MNLTCPKCDRPLIHHVPVEGVEDQNPLFDYFNCFPCKLRLRVARQEDTEPVKKPEIERENPPTCECGRTMFLREWHESGDTKISHWECSCGKKRTCACVPFHHASPLREKLAAYAHEAWSGWMKYMLSKSTRQVGGTWLIFPDFTQRWERQMRTPYAYLPEGEKESDREQADKILTLLLGALVPKSEIDIDASCVPVPWAEGWNACREEIIKRTNLRRKP